MNRDSDGGLWRAAFVPVFNHIQQVIDVNATIVVDVCEFDSKLVMKRIQVIGINIAIAVHVSGDSRAGWCNGRARGGTKTAAAMLIWLVPTNMAPADGGVAVVVAVDPAAAAGVVVRNRAAVDSGVAVFAVDPAAVAMVVPGAHDRIVRNVAVGDVGVAVVKAVDPAALGFGVVVVGMIMRNVAVGDVGAAVIAAGDPAAVVAGHVARDRAAADGGVAVAVAVDPAAVHPPGNKQGRIVRNVAVGDGGAAFVAGDSTAGVSRVVLNRAA